MTINRREFNESGGLVAGSMAVTGALEARPANPAEQLATRVPVTAIVNKQSETDPQRGRFVHRNYSGYLVRTNADIPELEVIFSVVRERDNP